MSKVVQSGLLSQPWEELLTLTAGLPQKTQEEVIGGKMALLRHNLEAKHGEDWAKMLNWEAFGAEIKGFTGDADATALFRLQEFVGLNEKLTLELARWNVPKGLRCAAIAEGGTVRVKAVLGPDNSVEFKEPVQDFPSETLMTQLVMIAPEDKK